MAKTIKKGPFVKTMDFIRPNVHGEERFQRFDGEKVIVTISFYESGYLHISVFGRDTCSRYFPEIYVRTDGDYRPTGLSIQTTSFGALHLDEMEIFTAELQSAIQAAKDIKEHFVIPIANGTYEKGDLIPREEESI